MDNIKEFENLKRLADNQRRDKARLEGQLSMLMSKLKEMGFSSVEDAQKEILKLENVIKSDELKLSKLMEEFTDRYEKRL